MQSRTRRTKQLPVAHVVEDDVGVAESVVAMLPGVDAKRYRTAESFLESAELQEFGFVIIDHGLPGMNGVELIDALNSRESTLSTILVTGSAEVALVIAAFERGITAFLEKPFSPRCLEVKVAQALDASRQACSHRAAVSATRQRAKRLTPREKQVFRHLVDGAHAKTIARQLGMAYNTVRVHRANVLKKMKVRSVVELANMARPKL